MALSKPRWLWLKNSIQFLSCWLGQNLESVGQRKQGTQKTTKMCTIAGCALLDKDWHLRLSENDQFNQICGGQICGGQICGGITGTLMHCNGSKWAGLEDPEPNEGFSCVVWDIVDESQCMALSNIAGLWLKNAIQIFSGCLRKNLDCVAPRQQGSPKTNKMLSINDCALLDKDWHLRLSENDQFNQICGGIAGMLLHCNGSKWAGLDDPEPNEWFSCVV